VSVLTAGEVAVDADQPEIPVGIDGETVMMPTPVRCAIRPRALRVRVPRDRPGVRPATPVLNWPTLRGYGRRGWLGDLRRGRQPGGPFR
jgi:hypothetical protein